MPFWQPRSLLQLAIIGFFAVLAPLCLAALLIIQTMDELADNYLEATRLVVDMTRTGQQIQRDLLELERRARQYLTLGDEELATLFENERLEVIAALESLQLLEPDLPSTSPDIAGLIDHLSKLSLPDGASAGLAAEPVAGKAWEGSGLEQEFALITERSRAMQKWLQASVDNVTEDNVENVRRMMNRLRLQVILAVVTTLLLLVVITYLINRPVKDLTNEIQQLGTQGLSHPIDISGPRELRELGIKLEWLRQKLRESERDKEQFLRHVSHELKTPLSSLREGADLLAEHVPGRLSQRQEEIVKIVRQNSIELQRLIENLVDYNQLPQRELHLEKINLADLCDELLSNHRILIDNKALQVSVQGTVDSWVADRSKLRTSLDNLLSNAINYTPEHGRIKLVWFEKSTTLVMELANSGEAIPDADKERIFEPFFQSVSKRSGPIKGSGIGLSVARECMQAQGGSLTLVPHGELPVCFRLVCPAR